MKIIKKFMDRLTDRLNRLDIDVTISLIAVTSTISILLFAITQEYEPDDSLPFSAEFPAITSIIKSFLNNFLGIDDEKLRNINIFFDNLVSEMANNVFLHGVATCGIIISILMFIAVIYKAVFDCITVFKALDEKNIEDNQE